MGIYFRHEVQAELMLAIFYGAVTDAELDAHITRVLGPEFDQPGKKNLVVFCQHTSTSGVSYQAVMAAGKRMQHAGFRKNGKMAIVAKTVVGFGLAKVYQVATEVMGMDDLRVLREHEFDAALNWLELDADISAMVMQKVAELEHLAASSGPDPS